MTTDNKTPSAVWAEQESDKEMQGFYKTLADVQPGGMVRLGDGQGQCKGCGRRTFHNFPQGDICLHCNLISDECRSTERVALDALVAAGHVDQARVDQALKVASALSAQSSPGETLPPEMRLGSPDYLDYLDTEPSPGGQGATSQVVSRMVSTAPERIFLQIGDGDYSNEPFPHPIGEEITWCADSIVESEVAYVRADLAARQPVGEPVGYFDPDVLAHLTEGLIDPVGVLRRKPSGTSNVPVWLGPPAQAVDLDAVRDIARKAFSAALPGSEVDAELRKLLALIDSQAVGK